MTASDRLAAFSLSLSLLTFLRYDFRINLLSVDLSKNVNARLEFDVYETRPTVMLSGQRVVHTSQNARPMPDEAS